MFLLCFSISILVGEAVFRRFLVYGMRVFHIQLLTSLLLMLPYSLAKSDEISLALSMLSGQMAYDTHSSRDQIKTAISFVLTFIAISLTYWLIKGSS
ncbi:MAG: hypothetical protein BA066_02125 [Candidatus Korarchaeota archaeon NZ13-K]|nr:MAG: hypothetical protein BA066_02125 [Candidatus Korarchaeota archaeon NZ13-K]